MKPSETRDRLLDLFQYVREGRMSLAEAADEALALATTSKPSGELDPGTAALTIEAFSLMNRRRCESYHGFGESLDPDSKYTLLAWACSVASEAGKVCDAVVGYEGLKERRAGKTREDIAEELADVITYCDLMIQKLGMWTPDVLVQKFNKVNARLEEKDPHCGAMRRFRLSALGGRQGGMEPKAQAAKRYEVPDPLPLPTVLPTNRHTLPALQTPTASPLTCERYREGRLKNYCACGAHIDKHLRADQFCPPASPPPAPGTCETWCGHGAIPMADAVVHVGNGAAWCSADCMRAGRPLHPANPQANPQRAR